MINIFRLSKSSSRFFRNSISFCSIKSNEKKPSSEIAAPKIPTHTDLKSYWNNFSGLYSKIMEANTQPILYSLLSNLDISNSSSILEASCGSGRSLPIVCALKKKSCKYLATDLSEEMLKRAVHRMKKVENDFQGCLNGREEEEPQENEAIEFEKNNISFRLINNENLSGLADNSFQHYFSNFSLHLVSDPSKMLSEAHRVLQPGGRAGFTVWGRRENSRFFTIIPQVLGKYGIKSSNNERSNFHLSNRDLLISMMEKAGFKNVLCWYQFFGWKTSDESDARLILSTPTTRKTLGELSEENRLKAEAEIIAAFQNCLQTKVPIGLEVLMAIGQK